MIESNADNASLDVSQTNDQNPLRWLVEDYSDVHAAAEIVTYMKSFDDPRLSKYFNPAVRDSEYHGSRVGAYSSSQWKDYYSLPKTNALDRLMWMNAAEVAFLKAEMAVNGWDVTGDAKTLYEEGIRLSFEQYQAENYTSYITGTARADRLFRSAQGQQLYAGHGLQRHRRMGRRPFGGKAAREDHHPEMDRPLSARNGGVGRAAPHGISAVLPHAHQHQCLERA